jgi:uncharacterized MnhB-related membrane protein
VPIACLTAGSVSVASLSLVAFASIFIKVKPVYSLEFVCVVVPSQIWLALVVLSMVSVVLVVVVPVFSSPEVALTTILLEKEVPPPIKLTPEVDTMANAMIEATVDLTMRLLSIKIPPLNFEYIPKRKGNAPLIMSICGVVMGIFYHNRHK